jgi:NTP pyrophosphatase (non-canonical NTP hydrolase)
MSSITFDEYQDFTETTRIYQHKITYPALGLAGESGEVAEKVKKMLRDDEGVLTQERRAALAKEIGDVLWYCAALSADLGLSLGEIAQINVDKLTARKLNNTISGDGDNR